MHQPSFIRCIAVLSSDASPLLLQFDSEGGSLPHFAALHPDFTVVIFLHDALGERESQTPSTLLGSEARTEHVAQVFLPDSLSGIRNLHDGPVFRLLHMQGNLSAIHAHRIHGILGEILDYPLKERGVDFDDDVVDRKSVGRERVSYEV